MHSDYIVFVDESGDHSMESINDDFPVFVLAFCVMHRDAYIDCITPAVRRIKFELFGHDQVILHERDIRKRLGHFSRLGGEERNSMLEQLNKVITDCEMTVIAVVINKYEHKKKYKNPDHPYHLAMQFGLERLSRFIAEKGQADRTTTVVCECRGAKEDGELELEFRRVCDGKNVLRQAMNFEIVMSDKRTNCEGLQLSDLLARPIGLHVMKPEQKNRAWDIIEAKMFRNAYGVLRGNGLKVFP